MNQNPRQTTGDAGGTRHYSLAPVPALVVTAEALALRRRIGPLGWVILEYLALCAERTERGWASPVGVRDMAGGVGVTKDTAARAVAALGAAGLVTLDRIETSSGGRRSGYLLHLPHHMRRIDGPDDAAEDGPARRTGPEHISAAGEQPRRSGDQATAGNGRRRPHDTRSDSQPATVTTGRWRHAPGVSRGEGR